MTSSSFLLPYQPSQIARRYSLVFSIAQHNKVHKIHYELALTCTARLVNGNFQLQIQKEAVYIDNKVPDSLLDGLAAQCGRILYPLLVRVSPRGVLLNIENGADIRRRWKEARPAMAQYYTGPIAEETLAGMDAVVAGDTFLMDALSNDWLYALLFAPIYNPYENGETEAFMRLPLIPYRLPLLYRLKLEASPELTRGGFIKVEGRGVYAEERSVEDVLRGTPIPTQGIHAPLKPKGETAITWKVYPHNGALFSVTGSCNLELPDGVEKTVAFEIYQLGRRDALPATPATATDFPPESIIVAVTEVPPKKGWFAFF